jgi:transcriptional regulator with XRE-family HTH domain
LSLAEIAKPAGLTRQALSRLARESEKSPGKELGSSSTMTAIARAWGVDLDWLQTGRGAPKRGKLSAKDVVLAEREWSEPARAAAMADKRERSAEQWRATLEAIESAFAGAPSSRPPRSAVAK